VSKIKAVLDTQVVILHRVESCIHIVILQHCDTFSLYTKFKLLKTQQLELIVAPSWSDSRSAWFT